MGPFPVIFSWYLLVWKMSAASRLSRSASTDFLFLPRPFFDCFRLRSTLSTRLSRKEKAIGSLIVNGGMLM